MMIEGTTHRRQAWASRHRWRALLVSLLAVVFAAAVTVTWQLRASELPERLNMGSGPDAHHATGHATTGMYPGADSTSDGIATAPVTSVTDLVAPPSSAPTKTFHLTAQAATLDLGGQTV